MSDRKDRVIKELKEAENEQEEIDKIQAEDKEKQQDDIISEGDRAERLKENSDFMYFLQKLTDKVEEITAVQNMRLVNIRKLTEPGKNTMDSIVANQIKEAVLGGEFLGLRQMSFNIKTAIKNKRAVLEQRKDEE